MTTVLPLAPIALGFFGLGTGYFVYGGSNFFNLPRDKNPNVKKALGQWGIWMPGFLQFVTGTYLFLGLTIFDAFQATPILYMAAFAFTAYGVHWFALGLANYFGADTTVDGFMAVAFLIISLTGATVFGIGGDYPVMILFIMLMVVYICDIPASLLASKVWGKAKAGMHLITGSWLMYLMFAASLNFALGYTLWL